MGLLDGKICLEKKCYKCCLRTEMILTIGDIYRLLRKGFKIFEFAYYDGEYWRLRNIGERCVFLNNDGLCKIYPDRPLGCRAYPIVMGEKYKCVPDDEICPHISLLSREELQEGCKILQNFFKELGEKQPIE
ncbi:MAG: YkgJ family cysteine cluster protein [Candidatus Njordarchaeales archaeon]